MTDSPQKKPFAFIALVGRPNCGKSTLNEHRIGEELSISPPCRRPRGKNLKGHLQTRRDSRLGSLTRRESTGGSTRQRPRARTRRRPALRQRRHPCATIVDLAREFGEEKNTVARIRSGAKVPCVGAVQQEDIMRRQLMPW